MPAHRLHVTVPEDHRAIIEFPETVPAGDVEILVLVPEESAGADEPQDLVEEGFPVFTVPPGARPITQEMVQSALEESRTEPVPLPLLRDPVPVEGVDLDDTSRLWEIE